MKAPAELQPQNGTPVARSLALGTEERRLQKGPAVNDPRRFDAPLDGAAVDAVVAAVRERAGKEQPLLGKKVAIAVESLFDATELRNYAHVLGALGAEVIYASRLSFPGWNKDSKNGWQQRNTFESTVTPSSDRVHQLEVTHELADVEAHIGDFAAFVLPGERRNSSTKRLSHRPEGEAFEDNPLFKVVAAAVRSPVTKVGVTGRGLWGVLGTATLPDSALRGATIVPSDEMMPEAVAIANFVGGQVGELVPGVAQKKLLFDAGRGSLALVEDLANQLIEG